MFIYVFVENVGNATLALSEENEADAWERLVELGLDEENWFLESTDNEEEDDEEDDDFWEDDDDEF